MANKKKNRKISFEQLIADYGLQTEEVELRYFKAKISGITAMEEFLKKISLAELRHLLVHEFNSGSVVPCQRLIQEMKSRPDANVHDIISLYESMDGVVRKECGEWLSINLPVLDTNLLVKLYFEAESSFSLKFIIASALLQKTDAFSH